MEQQGVMSTYQLTAHTHQGEGQGGILNRYGLSFANPDTIVNVLSDHDKLDHDALGIEILGDKVFINETVNTFMVKGLTIQQDGEDNEILAFKSSDVNHASDITEADTYGCIRKYNSNEGGVSLWGMSETVTAVQLTGGATNDNTDKDATAKAPISLYAMLVDGSDVGADGNLVTISNSGLTRFIFDEDGDMFYDGAAPANYDGFNDPAACHDLARYLYNINRPIKEQLTDFIKYNKADLVNMGVISDGNFVSTKNMTALILGAISQLHKENQLLQNKLKALEN